MGPLIFRRGPSGLVFAAPPGPLRLCVRYTYIGDSLCIVYIVLQVYNIIFTPIINELVVAAFVLSELALCNHVAQ